MLCWNFLPTTSVRLFYSRGWPLPQRSAVLCCCPPSTYMSLLRERCCHSFWSGGQFALLRSARRSDSSYLGPSSAAASELIFARPTGGSGLAMWSLRFPAHYSWITGNPEVILRTLESRVFNFPCLGRQKRVNFPKTRLCYAGLASPTI